MRNRVELLRAIEFTKEDLENILNLEDIDDFSDEDKDFMEEFKKVYELGLNQLEKFINKLDEEGKDLDVYSIKYYVRQLFNGPLGQYARQLSEDKNYFVPTPDIMGIQGNRLRSWLNTTLLQGYDNSLGLPVDHHNKLPVFIHETLESSISTVEDMFRGGMLEFSVHDNTLPIIDKEPQIRYASEPTGELQLSPHANYAVKDSYFYQVLEVLNISLFEEVEKYLGDENYRLYLDNKEYNPFENDSTSSNWEMKRKEGEEELDVDLLGKQIDSFEKRQSTLKVENIEKDKEYILNSNEGQLGN